MKHAEHLLDDLSAQNDYDLVENGDEADETMLSNESKKNKFSNRQSTSSSSSTSSSTYAKSNSDSLVRFYVRSLGWVKIDEKDLTPDRSSQAVNKCINDLSKGKKDFNDVVARWGQGKDLYMDLSDNCLFLIDPSDEKILNKLSLTSIRVWGVGRDNRRYFIYEFLTFLMRYF
jgi:amyloid beta (A4) precursor protein-binding family B protein 2 (Fe65-like)